MQRKCSEPLTRNDRFQHRRRIWRQPCGHSYQAACKVDSDRLQQLLVIRFKLGHLVTSPWLCPHRCRQRYGACASALFEPFFTSQLFLVRRYRLSVTKALSCLPRCDLWRRLQRVKSQWLWYDDDDGADKSVVWCCIVLAPVHRDRCGAALKKNSVSANRKLCCLLCVFCQKRTSPLASVWCRPFVVCKDWYVARKFLFLRDNER